MFACAPGTKLEKSWSDPSFDAKTTKAFTKVLIAAPFKDAATQRIIEDKIAAEIKSGVAIQSYNYLLPGEKDQKLVDAKLKQDGFDGVILMRLVDVDRSTKYSPGTGYYGGWYGYYSYTPGYFIEEKTFLIETILYSVAESKLLWSGTTSTLNPTSLDKTIDQIIHTVKYELQKKGFLRK